MSRLLIILAFFQAMLSEGASATQLRFNGKCGIEKRETLISLSAIPQDVVSCYMARTSDGLYLPHYKFSEVVELKVGNAIYPIGGKTFFYFGDTCSDALRDFHKYEVLIPFEDTDSNQTYYIIPGQQWVSLELFDSDSRQTLCTAIRSE